VNGLAAQAPETRPEVGRSKMSGDIARSQPPQALSGFCEMPEMSGLSLHHFESRISSRVALADSLGCNRKCGLKTLGNGNA